MSANDLIALDANYGEWLAGRGQEIEHPFVYYCVEQFLKPHVPTDEDIEYGITDGSNDGGVDGIYFLIDRDEFIRDDSNTSDRKPIKVSLLIFQVKSGPGSGFQMDSQVPEGLFRVSARSSRCRGISNVRTESGPRVVMSVCRVLRDVGPWRTFQRPSRSDPAK